MLRILEDAIHSSKSLNTLLHKTYGVCNYSTTKFQFWQWDKLDVLSCFSGTRVAVLKELREWTTTLSTTPSNIFWLCGLTQSGKSTIAMSVADWATEEGILGGALFSQGRQAKVRNLFTAIVHEIASFDTSTRKQILGVLEREENLMDRKLGDQFKQLIVEPLHLANRNSSKPHLPTLLIIDVLDKCEEEEAVELLELFLSHLSGHDHSHIRILVTSRPLPYLCSVFKRYEQRHRALHLEEVPASDSKQEIGYYLREELSQVHQKRGLSRPDNWPDRHDLDSLVNSSGELFCYAKQALRFVIDSNAGGGDPAKNLQIWLDHAPETQINFGLPFEMAEFYRHGLRDMDVSDIGVSYEVIARALAAIVLLQEPLVLDSHASLLKIDKNKVKTLLRSFHPIIISPDDPQTPPRPFHPSLRQYLTDRGELRASGLRRLFVDSPKQEAYLCGRCLDIISESLNRDSGARTNEGGETLVQDYLKDKVDINLSPTLRYACTYWNAHLSKADINDSNLKEILEKFVRRHLLIWVEASTVLQLTQKLGPSLQAAHEWSVSSYHSIAETDLA